MTEWSQTAEGPFSLSLTMPRYTLSKAERLSSVKTIDKLFAEGKSFSKYPLRLVWSEAGCDENPASPRVQVLFSVSRRRYKNAVDRNRIKRLMREAYRLQRPESIASLPDNRCFHLALLYTGTEILSLSEIQKSLASALKRWMHEITHTVKPPQEGPDT